MPNSVSKSYPTIADLRSGDLLFPKKPDTKILALHPGIDEAWSPLEGFSNQLAMPLSYFLESTKKTSPEANAYMGLLLSRLNRVFNGELLELIPTVTVADAIALAGILFDTTHRAGGPDIDKYLHAFGHVAMAFEEKGRWFVFEAGCTDYSHYRVSIAPYIDEEDANRPAGQKRGWATRREALGECVWTSRHPKLQPAQMTEILNTCKNWLGVPYGILEPGMMTNPDRFYCSELIQTAFKQQGLIIDNCQNWDWVIDQLAAGNPILATTLKLLKGIFKSGTFPLLSPKMIYTSLKAHAQFSPTDGQGQPLCYL